MKVGNLKTGLNSSRLLSLPRSADLPQAQKATAYRYLFDLDDAIEERDLVRKRRIMAMKFHPDRGGTSHAMSVVNEAYEFLLNSARA